MSDDPERIAHRAAVEAGYASLAGYIEKYGQTSLSRRIEALAPTPNPARVALEISAVSAAYDNEADPAHRRVLRIIYQTLLWSRAPEDFASPLSMIDDYLVGADDEH